MSLRHVSLRQLTLFESVARHRSLSRAAGELHVSQPAVSMQMRHLEDAVGLPLLEQVGRQLHLTDAGHELARCARSVLGALRESEEVFSALKGLRGGQIALAAVSTAKYFAPQLLATFLRRHPETGVRLVVTNREAIIRTLEENQADLVIMGQPPPELDLIATPFAPHPMVLIASPQHPLARRRRLRLADLAHEHFLVREPGSGTRQAMERFFAAQEMRPLATAEMSSNETIKQAVMAGMGLAFLSSHTIGLELEAGRLVTLPVAGLPVVRNWYVVHRAQKRLSPIASAFKDFLLAEGAAIAAASAGPSGLKRGAGGSPRRIARLRRGSTGAA